MTFAEQLKTIIKGNTMINTQKKAAEVLGVSIRNIENWVSGTNEPDELKKEIIIDKLTNYNSKPDDIQAILVKYVNGNVLVEKAVRGSIRIENQKMWFSGYQDIVNGPNILSVDLMNDKISEVQVGR